MTHRTIKDTCESLALTVAQISSDGLRRNWNATRPGQRVYWSTSFEGGVLGLPRVIVSGVDTHARTAEEIKYLLTQGEAEACKLRDCEKNEQPFAVFIPAQGAGESNSTK